MVKISKATETQKTKKKKMKKIFITIGVQELKDKNPHTMF